MPSDVLVWPAAVLRPSQVSCDPVAFTRAGPRSLSGLQRVTTTDRGYWAVAYRGVLLHTVAQRRVWNAIRTTLGGRAGVIAIPVWSYDSAPWLPGTEHGRFLVPHSDEATFSDGGRYSQAGILVELATAAATGDTTMTLRARYGLDDLCGVRFSYRHALYETGRLVERAGDLWTVEVFPDVRAAIPAGVTLEFDLPTVLVHLATDREMDTSLSVTRADRRDVAWVEAGDYWNDLAGS